MSVSSAIPVQPGEVVAGKFRVEKVLGVGGMGAVVAAWHEALHERVGIKFLLPEMLSNRGVLERFIREARAAVRLKSEHVCRVMDVGLLETGAPFIVMEYLEGADFDEVSRREGPMAVEDAVEYLLQASEAIAEAHALGIVHRDLKPANLFLTTARDGSPLVKVLDFGISKLEMAKSSASATQTDTTMGSPAYMAPEQAKSAKDADPRADIWALSVILFQLLTRRLPFESESVPVLFMMIMSDDAPPVTRYREDLPDALVDVIATGLARDRDQRFADIAELAEALRAFAPPRALPSIDTITGIMDNAEELRRASTADSVEDNWTMPTPVPVPSSPAPAAAAPPAPSDSDQELTRPLVPDKALVSTMGASAGEISAPPPTPARRPRRAVLAAIAAAVLALAATAAVVVATGGGGEDGPRDTAPAASGGSGAGATAIDAGTAATAAAIDAGTSAVAERSTADAAPSEQDAAIEATATRGPASGSRRGSGSQTRRGPKPSARSGSKSMNKTGTTSTSKTSGSKSKDPDSKPKDNEKLFNTAQ